ncbi:phosphotransferase [Micromonospora sp. BRA006-A]|nr:phosphotransferase [Micromonospora sp. BRA006-A]
MGAGRAGRRPRHVRRSRARRAARGAGRAPAPRPADLARDEILWWGEVAAGREPLPEPAAGAPLAELVALESRLPGYADAAPGLAHGDLRVDNLLIDPDGRAWLCDWPWLCHGPAWFDLAGLLLTAYAGGGRGRRVRRSPGGGGSTRRRAGRDARRAGRVLPDRRRGGPSNASPHLRAHQRWSGEQALGWLAERQGWFWARPTPPLDPHQFGEVAASHGP